MPHHQHYHSASASNNHHHHPSIPASSVIAVFQKVKPHISQPCKQPWKRIQTVTQRHAKHFTDSFIQESPPQHVSSCSLRSAEPLRTSLSSRTWPSLSGPTSKWTLTLSQTRHTSQCHWSMTLSLSLSQTHHTSQCRWSMTADPVCHICNSALHTF